MLANILIIDDNEGVRDAFILSLEATNTLFTASNGEEGIEMAKKNRPDLIFLDLKMTGMDGVETMSHLFDVCPNVPLYIVTGFEEEYMRELEEARLKGFEFKVCKKPLGCNDILLIVENVFSVV